MTKKDFIKRVLLIMNDAGIDGIQADSFIGSDAANVDNYIVSTYKDAWKLMAITMPKVWMTNKTFLTQSVVINSPLGKGFVVLPDDFYELSSFKMKGWNKSVYEAPYENDLISRVQNNPYTQGTPYRPVATISQEVVKISDVDTIIKALNYYTVPKGLTTHEIEKAFYIPNCTPLEDLEDDDDIAQHEKSLEPLAYLCAGCVFAILQKADLSAALTEKGLLLIPKQ